MSSQACTWCRLSSSREKVGKGRALMFTICAGPSGVSPLQIEALNALREPHAAWHTLEVPHSRQPCAELQGLHSETLYAVRVAAESSAGPSAFSAIAVFQTAETPPAPGPSAEVATVAATHIGLFWQSARLPGCPDSSSKCPQEYEVECALLGEDGASPSACAAMDWQSAWRGRRTECCISKLQPSCCYAFRVRSSQSKAVSLWGTEVNVQTLEVAPAAPCAITCLRSTPIALQVSWPAVEERQGCADVTAYRCDLATTSAVVS
jgi:hypothetical protein